MNVLEALAEIEVVLSTVVWVPLKDQDLPKSFRAYAHGWTFLIVVWHDDSGLRADGTATKGGLIMRLTPELAKKAAAGAVT